MRDDASTRHCSCFTHLALWRRVAGTVQNQQNHQPAGALTLFLGTFGSDLCQLRHCLTLQASQLLVHISSLRWSRKGITRTERQAAEQLQYPTFLSVLITSTTATDPLLLLLFINNHNRSANTAATTTTTSTDDFVRFLQLLIPCPAQVVLSKLRAT